MYTIAVRMPFSALHRLAGQGPESGTHGHDYAVEVQIRTEALDRNGYAVDIDEIEGALAETVDRFKGRVLNELPEFEGVNPSLEHFCRIVHGLLDQRLAGPRIIDLLVKLWETPDIWASYTERP